MLTTTTPKLTSLSNNISYLLHGYTSNLVWILTYAMKNSLYLDESMLVGNVRIYWRVVGLLFMDGGVGVVCIYIWRFSVMVRDVVAGILYIVVRMADHFSD